MNQKNRKFMLLYHVVFVCKYRRKALIDIESDLKDSILNITSKSDNEVVEMECDKNHIHLLIKRQPKISILSIVKRLKQETTWQIWEQKESHIRKYYWGKRTLWSDGYFCNTIGNISKEMVID